jgi:hypothetical protein
MTNPWMSRRAPPCKDGKRHQWKKGADKYRQSGICARCGYDVFDQMYVKE